LIYKKLSVVICTYNRCELLRIVLFSILKQKLPIKNYELIIVNDGSSDLTSVVVNDFASRLPIVYIEHKNGGLAFSKNIGFSQCSGDIILFLDDDDILDEYLLYQHLDFHNKNININIAMLGYTDLDEKIRQDPLMHYVTQIEHLLYSYPSIRNTQILNFEYAWGGRTSFKMNLLNKEEQLFNPIFKFGCEDIELGFRLHKKHNLKVIFNKKALSFTIRNISFSEFCLRMQKQGFSSKIFLEIHNCREISEWTNSLFLIDNYNNIKNDTQKILETTSKIDFIVRNKIKSSMKIYDFEYEILYKMYKLSFYASKSIGFISKKSV